MSKELLSRLKIERHLANASRAVATYVGTTIDTMKLIATALSDMYDNPQNAQVIVDVTTFGGGGTIDITVRHKNDNEDFVVHSTIGQMAATDGETLYVFEIKNFRRFVRIDAVVAGATSRFAVLANYGHSRGNPELQAATELVVTNVTT